MGLNHLTTGFSDGRKGVVCSQFGSTPGCSSILNGEATCASSFDDANKIRRPPAISFLGYTSRKSEGITLLSWLKQSAGFSQLSTLNILIIHGPFIELDKQI